MIEFKDYKVYASKKILSAISLDLINSNTNFKFVCGRTYDHIELSSDMTSDELEDVINSLLPRELKGDFSITDK